MSEQSTSNPLAIFESWARGQAEYCPGSPGAAAWAELCRLRRELAEARAELRELRQRPEHDRRRAG